jgi:hypothetical protein
MQNSAAHDSSSVGCAAATHKCSRRSPQYQTAVEKTARSSSRRDGRAVLGMRVRSPMRAFRGLAAQSRQSLAGISINPLANRPRADAYGFGHGLRCREAHMSVCVRAVRRFCYSVRSAS